MISNYKQYYKLIEYLSQFTKSRMGLILGVDSLVDMFEENITEILMEVLWRLLA